MSSSLRAQVLHRDQFRCRCCGIRERLTLHHLIPRRDGGGNYRSNLLTLCARCHRGWHNAEARWFRLDFKGWLKRGEDRAKAIRRSQLLREVAVARNTGLSFTQLALDLNRGGFATPRGRDWTGKNLRAWVERNAPDLLARKTWRLVRWPYFAEPVAPGVWRWREVRTPAGVCDGRGRKPYSSRYDLVGGFSRHWDRPPGWLTVVAGFVLLSTDRKLRGSKPFKLDIPPEWRDQAIMLRRGPQLRRVKKCGENQFSYVGQRVHVPESWEPGDSCRWVGWESVDQLLLPSSGSEGAKVSTLV